MSNQPEWVRTADYDKLRDERDRLVEQGVRERKLLQQATAERDEAIEALTAANDDGCGWKPKAEDALALVRDMQPSLVDLHRCNDRRIPAARIVDLISALIRCSGTVRSDPTAAHRTVRQYRRDGVVLPGDAGGIAVAGCRVLAKGRCEMITKAQLEYIRSFSRDAARMNAAVHGSVLELVATTERLQELLRELVVEHYDWFDDIYLAEMADR